VENDPLWGKTVRERLQEEGLRNVTIQMASVTFASEQDVYTSDFLQFLCKSYDIIVVDNQDFGGQGVGRLIRTACFEQAERWVNPGGMVVVDDSWRLTSLRTHNQAKKVRVFETVGPCRMGVTSTDVYLY
jgi:spermidine synthase